MREAEYRNEALHHLKATAAILSTNVSGQKQTEEKKALALFINLIGTLIDSMDDVKNDQAFVAVVKGLEMVLKKEFFDHISQSKQSQPRQETQPKAPQRKEVKRSVPNIGDALLVDPNDLPESVREKLAAELKKMGIPASEVDVFFDINSSN